MLQHHGAARCLTDTGYQSGRNTARCRRCRLTLPAPGRLCKVGVTPGLAQPYPSRAVSTSVGTCKCRRSSVPVGCLLLTVAAPRDALKAFFACTV